MNKKTIDARGLPCPQPVIRTRAALQKSDLDELVVLVDSKESAQNVINAARSLGWDGLATPEQTESTSYFVVQLHPAKSKTTQPQEKTESHKNLVFFIPSDKVGGGDEKLGSILMMALIKTIPDLTHKPQTVIFMNKGVSFCCEGSELIEAIKKLEESGIKVLCCGTCLDYYGLKEKLRVGRVSNMFEILDTLASADKIVRV